MKFLTLAISILLALSAYTQTILLRPDRVFDGTEVHEGWVVLVENEKIKAIGTPGEVKVLANTQVIDLPGTTLLPGLIEGHSHILLHPYNEVSWDDQVLQESQAERVVRATVHARATLMAGFTTIRDLGSEGADYADVGIKRAIEKGIIPGPRMLVAGRAIVATGSYGPKGFAPNVQVPLGAEEADGVDNLIKVVRDQIGKGADIIKVYADYRWGFNNQAMPTFSIEELKLIVETAKSSGRAVVAHAATAEGMRRATLAGVETIEHGDDGTKEVFQLMKERGVAFCPTLAAGDAISQYRGWKKGHPNSYQEEPERIRKKRESMKLALESGVTILAGGDVGVFTHGDNARELDLLVEYGMKPLAVLRAVTSVNAKTFHLDNLGKLQPGLLADLIAVQGKPDQQISDIRQVKFVMKNGKIEKSVN